MALDICSQFEKKVTITGRDTGATAEEYANYVMDWVNNSALESSWTDFVGDKVTV